jgi:N-acetylmuramic acid 6-phosphate (MurNAc-6-P) etherase
MRAWRKTVPFGLAAGTLYFIVIAALSIFTTVLASGSLSLFGLVLFVGVGAGLGLLLGVIDGAALPLASGVNQQRVVGGLAGGLPVLAFTAWEYQTGTIGVLAADITTVIAVPTIVAAIGCAAFAPRLAAQAQPKRPEM